jgi:hypothetical protein
MLPCLWFGHNPDAEPVEFNVCEGIATAMSIMAVKGSAISAIDASNLPKVVEHRTQCTKPHPLPHPLPLPQLPGFVEHSFVLIPQLPGLRCLPYNFSLI